MSAFYLENMGKVCKWACGTELTWNTADEFYANPDGTRHNCPNRNKPPQPKQDTPMTEPRRTKEVGYYEGIRKVAELAIADANAQLQDPKWAILKVVEKLETHILSDKTVSNTKIVYILGLRE